MIREGIVYADETQDDIRCALDGALAFLCRAETCCRDVDVGTCVRHVRDAMLSAYRAMDELHKIAMESRKGGAQ